MGNSESTTTDVHTGGVRRLGDWHTRWVPGYVDMGRQLTYKLKRGRKYLLQIHRMRTAAHVSAPRRSICSRVQ
jgi:hypothetical protein